MVWVSLGTLFPSYDWKTVDMASVGGAVYRCIHSFEGENPGRLLVRSQFGENVSAEVIVIYPDALPTVFVFKQDELMLDINLGVRYLQVRMPNGVRVYENTNWFVEIQEWI